MSQRYASDHERVPGRVIVATESFPAQSLLYWEGVWNYSWVIGDFIWTAIDYIGESGIGANGENTPSIRACGGYCPQPWSYYISFCGDIDLVGLRKPQSYYRAVLWNVSSLELAVHAPIAPHETEAVASWGWPDERQSWSWPQAPVNGTVLSVNVYSRLDGVMLLLNGKALEAQPRKISQATAFTATYEVPYVPGNLTAVGIVDGRVAAARTLLTAGPGYRVVLAADNDELAPNRDDLAYVTASIVDRYGNLVPFATDEVSFEVVSGNGEIAAVGSGDPIDTASFYQQRRRSYRGHTVAIIRPGTSESAATPTDINVTATAQGLLQARITIRVRAPHPDSLSP